VIYGLKLNTLRRLTQSAGITFDRIHILVREAEMMADFVHEDMGNDMT
jgi:hypothetical protein